MREVSAEPSKANKAMMQEILKPHIMIVLALVIGGSIRHIVLGYAPCGIRGQEIQGQTGERQEPDGVGNATAVSPILTPYTLSRHALPIEGPKCYRHLP